MEIKQQTEAILADADRIAAIRQELESESDASETLEGCEDCNELEAYPGARFCASCSEDRAIAYRFRIPVSKLRAIDDEQAVML